VNCAGGGLNVVRLDARHASAALTVQMNKTDQNDAERLAQIMRTSEQKNGTEQSSN
jgi:transposase